MQTTRRPETADAIVVGGGMFGSAIAYGLVRAGLDVAVLDEGDDALRAARGNFGLVWVQSKGLGMQPYADWSRESAHLWNEFARELEEVSGIHVAHQNEGGLNLLLGEEELAKRRAEIAQMRKQAGPAGFDCEIVGRDEAQKMLPDATLGKDVVGASFCPHDGHVNPLLLLRALHTAIRASGGRYLTERRVEAIRHDGHAFVAETAKGPISAPKIVLGAGHGAPRLGPMVGLKVPIRPERGQVLITERVRPFRVPGGWPWTIPLYAAYAAGVLLLPLGAGVTWSLILVGGVLFALARRHIVPVLGIGFDLFEWTEPSAAGTSTASSVEVDTILDFQALPTVFDGLLGVDHIDLSQLISVEDWLDDPSRIKIVNPTLNDGYLQVLVDTNNDAKGAYDLKINVFTNSDVNWNVGVDGNSNAEIWL